MSDQSESDLYLVEEANKIESNLTEWEVEFIESMNKWLKKNETLTEKQRAMLEKILTEKG